MSKNQNGFSVIEGLLILVIVGILGGVGWYVWDSNKKSNDIYDKTDNNITAKSSPKPEAIEDELKIPENWTVYEDKDSGIKFPYPEEWNESRSFLSSLSVSEPSKVVFYEGCASPICEVRYNPKTQDVAGRNGTVIKKSVASHDTTTAYLIAEKGSYNCGGYGLLILTGEKAIQGRLSLCTEPIEPNDHELSDGQLPYVKTVKDLEAALKLISVN
jgi:hypothetical protein